MPPMPNDRIITFPISQRPHATKAWFTPNPSSAFGNPGILNFWVENPQQHPVWGIVLNGWKLFQCSGPLAPAGGVFPPFGKFLGMGQGVNIFLGTPSTLPPRNQHSALYFDVPRRDFGMYANGLMDAGPNAVRLVDTQQGSYLAPDF